MRKSIVCHSCLLVRAACGCFRGLEDSRSACEPTPRLRTSAACCFCFFCGPSDEHNALHLILHEGNNDIMRLTGSDSLIRRYFSSLYSLSLVLTAPACMLCVLCALRVSACSSVHQVCVCVSHCCVQPGLSRERPSGQCRTGASPRSALPGASISPDCELLHSQALAYWRHPRSLSLIHI